MRLVDIASAAFPEAPRTQIVNLFKQLDRAGDVLVDFLFDDVGQADRAAQPLSELDVDNLWVADVIPDGCRDDVRAGDVRQLAETGVIMLYRLSHDWDGAKSPAEAAVLELLLGGVDVWQDIEPLELPDSWKPRLLTALTGTESKPRLFRVTDAAVESTKRKHGRWRNFYLPHSAITSGTFRHPGRATGLQ